jgi:hypothetical protein
MYLPLHTACVYVPTGHGIGAKQIRHFEQSEARHEEDLERVRLRNISLRTTFRKLERTLR